MHELSLCHALVEQIQELKQKNNVLEVLSVQVEVGALSGVVPDCLDFAWPEAVKKTTLEKTKLNIMKSPLIIECRACQQKSTLSDVILLCPECNAINPRIISGKEFKLVNMEVI